MAELDLSLSDALADSVPQPGPESLVQRDFVAELEAETFDDEVGETVVKMDYLPLLDNDDTRADSGTALENGEQESHGVQKPGSVGGSWPDQTGYLPTDLQFSPDASTLTSCHASNLAVSPDDQIDCQPGHERTAYPGGDEREGESSDRKQKKKKKRRQKIEGSCENSGNRGHFEVQAQGENTSSTEDIYHRIGPSRDGEADWEEQLGKCGGRGKRGKSRKKIPEEWGMTAEPLAPTSAAAPQITEEVLLDLGSSVQSSFAPSNQNPWNQEIFVEESLVPKPLSQDLFSVASISPLVLNSALNATAAPFTMPSTTNCPTFHSMPGTFYADDSFDLMDTQKSGLDQSSHAFSLPLSPERNIVDSGMSDNTSFAQESSVQGIPEEDTSAFSPASPSSQGHSPEVQASAPPISPTDALWVSNESQIRSSTESLDFNNTKSPGHPFPLGLSFDTPSPAPLRSPKTTAQDFNLKDEKKKNRKSNSSSVKSPTSPGENFPQQASPVISPSCQSVASHAFLGSGLNPSAKPFFPSFANSMEDGTAVQPVESAVEDMMESSAIKKEKLGDDMKTQTQEFNTPDMTEKKSVKVEFASCETLTKVEKDMEKTQIERETEKNEAEYIKVEKKEDVAEKVPEKEAEVVKERDEEKCGKLITKEKGKEAETDSEKELEECGKLMDKEVDKLEDLTNKRMEIIADSAEDLETEKIKDKQAKVVQEKELETFKEQEMVKEEIKHKEAEIAQEKKPESVQGKEAEIVKQLESKIVKEVEKIKENETEMVKVTEIVKEPEPEKVKEVENIQEKETKMVNVTDIVKEPGPETVKKVENFEEKETKMVKVTEIVKEPEPETIKYREEEIVKEPGSEKVKNVETIQEKETEMAKVTKIVKEPEPETVKEVENIQEKETEMVNMTEIVKEPEPETVKKVETIKEKETEMVIEADIIKEKETERVKEADIIKEKETERVKEADIIKEKETERVKEAEMLKEKVTETVKDKAAEMVKKLTDKENSAETAKLVQCEKFSDIDADNKKEENKGKDKELEILKKNDTEKKTEAEIVASLTTETEDKISKLEILPDKITEIKEVDIKIEKTETVTTNKEETEHTSTAKSEKMGVKEESEKHVESVEKTPELTSVTPDAEIPDTKAEVETKMTAAVGGNEKADADAVGVKAPVKKMQKSGLVERSVGKNVAENKDRKKDNAAKPGTADKVKTMKPATNGSSAGPSKDLGSANKKTKPAVGASKLKDAPKPRLNSATAVSAVPPRPTLSSSTTSDRKMSSAKAPPTAGKIPKRPSSTGATAFSATTASRDPRPKTSAEMRAPAPKTGAAASTAATTKTRTASTAATKPSSSRTMLSARSSTSAVAKKPPVSTTDSKAGEEKKPSTIRTSAAEASKTKTTTATTTRSSASAAITNRPRGTTAKPVTPSSTAAPEKKAAGLRTSHTASSTTTTTKTTTQSGLSTVSETRNARSKTGSTSNTKQQLGGAKPQILSKKLDLSKVTSKCGSKDNIKHKPGGGNVKIESHKVSFKEKVQPKVGSGDSMSRFPAGQNVEAEGEKEKTEGNGVAALVSDSEPGLTESPTVHTNGLSDGAPCQGITEPPVLDSAIPETN